MCLSTVYRGSAPTEENKLIEYVTNIDVDEAAGTVRLIDITGEALDVRGKIRSVDLVKNVIFIEAV